MGATFVGMPVFPAAARAALADTQLRHNLAHATGTIRDKRARVVAEVPDWEDLRAAGAAIKDATLADLEQHLIQLEARLTEQGAVVHWARDAEEANRIVADVAKSHGLDEVVKVKSMVTQEIGLNEALAEEGIAAWETDLAELIVQLGDDLPSHILVPAIHRNRAEIRQIFLDHMAAAGRPAPDGLTDEPAELASAARLHLREKFLGAKMAVSGANFAVAETGTLVVVESEGNGRMCLTLPGRARLRRRHREGRADVRRPRRVPAAASAIVHRRADEPLHLDLERGDARRRAAGGARRTPRQRPHPRARRRGRPPGAALHPLLRLPQRLPGLRAGRRPRLRLGLPGPDRRDPQPADARSGGGPAGRLAAVRLVAVRRLLRGVPGQDRHPRRARGPARPGRRRAPRRDAEAGSRRDEGRLLDVRILEAARVRRAVRAARHRARAVGCPSPRPGPVRATCRRDRSSRSGPGGSARTGDGTMVEERGTSVSKPSAREEILARVRAATATATATPYVAPARAPTPPRSTCSSNGSRTTGRSSSDVLPGRPRGPGRGCGAGLLGRRTGGAGRRGRAARSSTTA